MLKDCLEVFKNYYEQIKQEDPYLIHEYILDKGDYLLINKEGECIQSLNVSTVNPNEIDRNSVYENFCLLDQLSRLVSINKAIANKKIHSNNYFSFFVKKESLVNKKDGLEAKHIDEFFDRLSAPEGKKDKPKFYKINKEYEAIHGGPDIDKLERNRQWIKDHIFNITEEFPNITMNKDYLKIFFEEDLELIEIESNRYFMSRIYNTLDTRVELEDTILGMPNDNIGLNDKKAFLKCLSRKNPTPYLIDVEEIWLQKKFFDFLRNKVNQKLTNIYIDEEIHCLPYNQIVDFPFSGYYMRIRKGTEIIIDEFDTIAYLNNSISPCVIPKSIEIDYSATNYQSQFNTRVVDQISELNRLINTLFFDNKLGYSYFKDASEIEVKHEILKQSILLSREAFFEWFYKGNESLIRTIFPKISLNLIKHTIKTNYRLKAQEQWMLREGIINYFNRGDMHMADNMKEKLDIIEVKINSKEQPIIENDIEYAIAVGQLTNYLLSLNESSSPKHSLVNPILNLKNDKRIKEELRKLFVRYNHSIESNSRRFGNLYSMVQGYSPDKINEDALIYGYITNSLIYKKGKKDNEQ